MSDHLTITNCRLWNDPEGDPVSIIIEDGRIKEITKQAAPAAKTLDAAGHIAAPGFIDVHLQGAGGADALDGTDEALRKICEMLPRYGTTGLLATTVYLHGEENGHLGVIAANTGKDLNGAKILGIHIEGPFISRDRLGMIAPRYVCDPNPTILKGILELCAGQLAMMTIAPELHDSLALVEMLKENGVIPSLGHTDANYRETQAGLEAGINHVTHLFNAMPGLHHREPGPLAAIFEDDSVSAQLISDGVHLHPAVVRLALEALGPERTCCITDGFRAIGLPEGEYDHYGLKYKTAGGAARSLEGTLIGCAIGQNELLQRMIKFTTCSLQEAVITASVTPAKLLGLKNKGKLAAGCDADVVLLDEDLNVFATLVGGKVVYRKGSSQGSVNSR